jgi:hypothetical protein
MLTKPARTLALAALAMISFASTVNAQITRTFTLQAPQTTGSWTIADNWTPAGVPNSFDKVIIPAGLTCEIPFGFVGDADTIWIKATISPPTPGILEFKSSEGGLLPTGLNLWNHAETIDHDSRIDGHLILGNNRSQLTIKNADHTIIGRGKIEGTGPGGTIFVDAGLTLKSRLAAEAGGIRGSLSMSSSSTAVATFINEGKVEARQINGQDSLSLASTLILDDTVGSRWHAVECGILCFNRQSSLNGDFLLDKLAGANARFNINESVDTAGTFTFNSGTLFVRGDMGSKSFCFSFLGAGTCASALPCWSGSDCCLTSVTPGFPGAVEIVCNADAGACALLCGPIP